MILQDTPEWGAAVTAIYNAEVAWCKREGMPWSHRNGLALEQARAALPSLLQGVARLVRENYHNIDEGLSIADFIARIAEGK